MRGWGVVARLAAASSALALIAVPGWAAEQPTGTAHAVLAARAWADGHDCVVVNGDNLYPVAALRAQWSAAQEADSPPDLPKSSRVEGMPEKLRRELAELGLL